MIPALVLTAAIVSHAIVPAAPGPNRIDPDVSMLSGTSSPLRYDVTAINGQRRFQFEGGLDDLRLRDENGSEVQYLLVAPPARVPVWKETRTISPIPATKTTSGIEAAFGAPMTIDRISIAGIPAPFLKRLRVDGSGDRVHWTVLAPETTLFDLPEQQLRNLEVGFTPGEYRYLRLVWDDRSSARVREVSGIKARLSDLQPAPQQLAIPLEFRKKTAEAGKSRYRLSLPGPHLPVASIELQVMNPNVYRNAAVSEPRFNGSTLEPAELGNGRLRRAQRDGTVAEEMAIPISFPAGADLDLVVDDGNSGPLNINRIVARLAPLPWIYFESANDAPLTATWGDPSLRLPHYDLEASRDSIERTHPPLATLPAKIARPPQSTATKPLPLAGAPLDRKPFRRSRVVAPLPRGLTSLVLDADVLAHSSLNDLRLVEPTGRQVPYLLERRDAPLPISLPVPARVVSGSSSMYRFDLPYDRFPQGTSLVISTSARVFDRNVVLQRPADESHGREAEVLERTEWRSADPDSDAPSITFTTSLSGTAVELRVDEGDNAALPITSAQLLLPSYALRFFSSGRPITLYYDDPSAQAPRYDLALLAPQLLSESSREVTLPPFTVPRITPRATERFVFWGVIGVATVVLLITLGRLLTNAS